MKKLLWLIVVFIVIAVDQVTKSWAMQHLAHNIITVLPFFNLRLAFNTGAAFSFLNSAAGWQNGLFIGLALAVSVFLFGMILRSGWSRFGWIKSFALSLICGGALGNAIDRLNYGFVIDFIDLHINQWHWPTFNIADSAIFIGAVLWIGMLLMERE